MNQEFLSITPRPLLRGTNRPQLSNHHAGNPGYANLELNHLNEKCFSVMLSSHPVVTPKIRQEKFAALNPLPVFALL
tara:strand:- start:470 stop:700 length:231 start_codon:yes stop_codon:yes gene_type:complete